MTVALGFLAFSLLFGVISWEGVLNDKGSWNTLIWYGGIVGMATYLGNADFFKWIAEKLGAQMNLTGYNPLAVLFVLIIVSLAVRYLFASTAAYVAAFIPVLLTIGMAAQVPTLPLAFMLAFSSGYGSLLTHYGGAVAPVLFGTGFVSQTLWWKMGAIIAAMNLAVYFLIGLPVWKLIAFLFISRETSFFLERAYVKLSRGALFSKPVYCRLTLTATLATPYVDNNPASLYKTKNIPRASYVFFQYSSAYIARWIRLI